MGSRASTRRAKLRIAARRMALEVLLFGSVWLVFMVLIDATKYVVLSWPGSQAWPALLKVAVAAAPLLLVVGLYAAFYRRISRRLDKLAYRAEQPHLKRAVRSLDDLWLPTVAPAARQAPREAPGESEGSPREYARLMLSRYRRELPPLRRARDKNKGGN